MIRDLISIIVPIYNVGDYLLYCVNSLRKQSYRKIEIILVDDGSTDESSVICDNLTKLDSRIMTIHQKNSGVSVARNVGFNNANGEYIMFVDADDIVSEYICEILYKNITLYQTDIALCSCAQINEQNDARLYSKSNGTTEIILSNLHATVYKITETEFCAGVNVWAKLYKYNIAKKIRFKEGFPLGEDQEYVFSYLEYCDKASIINEPLYGYVCREGSAVNQQFTIEKNKKLIEVFDEIVKKKYLFDNGLRNRITTFRIIQCELTIANRMIKQDCVNEPILRELQKYIRKHLLCVLRSDYSIKKIIQIVTCGICFRLYCIFIH